MKPVKENGERWSAEQVWAWYAKAGPLRGCNYIPRTAVNQIEMWQGETFNEKVINEELGWAEALRLNTVRVFLHYLVWEADPEVFKERLNHFLEIAARHNIRPMIVLFDDCWNQEPKLGLQDPPIPGVHNSRWAASPGRPRVLDRKAWPRLEEYVKNIVGSFAKDERVLAWDLYNEPGNAGLGEKSLPLVESAFKWAREVEPSQPLTTGLWADFNDQMHKRFAELSDIITFHSYDPPQTFETKIRLLLGYKRPILCTEFLRRQVGNTFAAILPILTRYHVGWYFWGLVAGKTQTYYDWSCTQETPCYAPPRVWQHDLLYPDGSPYSLDEVNVLFYWAQVQDTVFKYQQPKDRP
ncbi:MAG: cellulase family glycosylhydrolase [Thermofilaceae archaeon]